MVSLPTTRVAEASGLARVTKLERSPRTQQSRAAGVDSGSAVIRARLIQSNVMVEILGGMCEDGGKGTGAPRRRAPAGRPVARRHDRLAAVVAIDTGDPPFGIDHPHQAGARFEPV